MNTPAQKPNASPSVRFEFHELCRGGGYVHLKVLAGVDGEPAEMRGGVLLNDREYAAFRASMQLATDAGWCRAEFGK